MTISPFVERLAERLQNKPPLWPTDPKSPKINVSQMFSNWAFLYEKLRNTVDFQEEHLLRRIATERILKRLVLLEQKRTDLAKPLIIELIKARYVPNNCLPESKYTEVENIIKKYLYLINEISKRRGGSLDKINRWLLSIAARDIERNIHSYAEQDAVVQCMYNILYPRIKFASDLVTEKDIKLQTYIAVQRALYKDDPATTRHFVFNIWYPEWRNPSLELVDQIANHIDEIKLAVEEQVNHPARDMLLRLMNKNAIYFHILKEVINDDPGALNNPQALQEKIIKHYGQRFKAVMTKLPRYVIRSALYVFITKMMVALILEVPFDVYILKRFHYIPIIINSVFHPVLLFIIAMSAQVPRDNVKKVIEGIKIFVYEQTLPRALEVKRNFRKNLLLHSFLNFIYFVTYLVTFGVIIYVLWRLHFSIVSGIIFVLFISIISFFGLRARNSVKELIVMDEKQTTIGVIFDFLTLPILRFGRWMAIKAPKINVFVFVLDFIVETPFKAIVKIFEEFIAFLKEKKEELY